MLVFPLWMIRYEIAGQGYLTRLSDMIEFHLLIWFLCLLHMLLRLELIALIRKIARMLLGFLAFIYLFIYLFLFFFWALFAMFVSLRVFFFFFFSLDKLNFCTIELEGISYLIIRPFSSYGVV